MAQVVASEKGVVVGRISFEDAGDPIDCTRMGVGGTVYTRDPRLSIYFSQPNQWIHLGKAIPPFVDRITNIRSDAKFILLGERHIDREYC